jgi:hypothetical protein
MKEKQMVIIPPPTPHQKQALGVARAYFETAATHAQTHLMTLSTVGARGMVAAEFAQSFRRSSEVCQMVLEVFDAWTPELPT